VVSLIVGCVCYCRLERRPPLFPLRTRYHLAAAVVLVGLSSFANTRVFFFADEYGYVEELVGWPVPVADHSAIYSGTEHNPVFCCSRCGGFSLEHFRAHPELYQSSESPWEIAWPLLIPHAIFWVLAASLGLQLTSVLIRWTKQGRKAESGLGEEGQAGRSAAAGAPELS
jgi:hypothetical protein